MSRMATTKFKRVKRCFVNVTSYSKAHVWFGESTPRQAICFVPGNRPDPLEESAASQTWREMTAHQREQKNGL